MKGLCLLVSLATFLLMPFSMWASDASKAREKFAREAELMRKYPMNRLRFIETCTSYVLENVSDDDRAELERLNDMPAAQAVADVCGSIVRGMISGELTYETYIRMFRTENDSGPATIPDYK